MINVVMPKLGLTMVEGVIQKWLKSEGDSVNNGEPILEIETDKLSDTVQAPATGILGKILFHEQGTTVPCSNTIAYILEEGEDISVLEDIEEEVEPIIESKIESKTTESSAVVQNKKTESVPKQNQKSEITRKISPAARKYAKDNNIDINSVTEGANGKIELDDVKAYYESTNKEQSKYTPTAKVVADELGVDLSTINKTGRITKSDVESFNNNSAIMDVSLDENDQLIPMSGMRKAISQRMTLSKQSAPHFYVSVSADVTNANDLLSSLKYKASFHDLLIKILATALSEYPAANVHVYDDKIILKNRINVGIAVAVNNGLLVPVVKDVKSKSLKEIAECSSTLIEKARNGQISNEDCQGNTFTISNLGMFGVESFTAIINQPEGAIMAVGKIMKQPVVFNDQICIRPIIKITVSFDHRAIDGVEGAKFLSRVKELLENPSLLL